MSYSSLRLAALGTALAAIPFGVQAQELASADVPPLGEQIVVTATPIARSALATPAQVDALDGDLKRRLQMPSLGETLDDLAGIATINTGGQVGKPVIRGLSGNRIRVLSNGVGLNFQQFGVRHPVNIDPFIADRIEVVRGAASVQFGSDVIGGAVNAINETPYGSPREPASFGGVLTAGYASAFDQITTALEAEAMSGPWGVDGTFVFRDSTGISVPDTANALETGNPRDPLVTGDLPFTDFDQMNGAIGIGRAFDWGGIDVRWEGWRADQNYLVPDPPPPNGNPLQGGGIGQRLENDIVQLRGDIALGGNWRVEPLFTYVRNLRLANAGPPEPVPLPTTRDSAVIDLRRDSLTGRVVFHHGPLAGVFNGQIGVQVDYEMQSSRGPTALVPGGTVENYAVFAFEEVKLGRLTLDAGVRVDHRQTAADPDETVDDSGIPGASADPDIPPDAGLQRQTFTTATGGVGASYFLAENLVIAANVGTGFRAPTLFDLFANGVHGGVAAVQIGDPTLREERSLNTDLALRFDSDMVQFRAAVYRNQIDNFIFPGGTDETDPASGLPIFQVQQDDAVLYGGDIDLSVSPTPWFEWRLTYERVEGSLEQNGTEVPLLPADRLSNTLTVRHEGAGRLEDLFLSADFRYTFRKDAAGLLEPFGQFDAPPPPFGTGSTGDYFRVDLGAGARMGRFGLQIQANNLFDRAYRDFLDTYKNITLSPGRDVRLTLTAEF